MAKRGVQVTRISRPCSTKRQSGDALKGLSERHIHVQGHTDNAPIKKELLSLGGYDNHWELSTAQATAVRLAVACAAIRRAG